MAKKDGFSFDTGSKFNLNLGSFKSLTKKQKETILIAVIGIVVVAFVVATVILISTVNGGNLGGNNNGGGSGNAGNAGLSDSTITSISVLVKPHKTSYYVGDPFEVSGLEIMLSGTDWDGKRVRYSDSPNEFFITGFDSSAPTNEQTITVEYKGFTDTFTVKILEIPASDPVLTSIYLTPAPKGTCKIGKTPSVKNVMLVRVYENGMEESIPLSYSHLYDYEDDLLEAQVGDTVTVRVRYVENGLVAETSFTVTIIE